MSLKNRVKYIKIKEYQEYSIKRIGYLHAKERWIRIYSEFFKQHIQPELLKKCESPFIYSGDWNFKSIELSIKCPLCKNGFITLTNKERDYSSGNGCFMKDKYHVGDSYVFNCSECDLMLTYTNQWMWID